LSRLATAFVLGYHGCDRSVAQKAVIGEIDLLQSEREYDWLGPGAYFWESDPQRALEWARWRANRGDYDEPCVLGAAIDLGNCLDLVSRRDLELVREAYDSFKAQQELSGLPMPENENLTGDPNGDLLFRKLDCAVIRHLHAAIESIAPDERLVQPFDTVRGLFTEGAALYPGSGFRAKSHVQIAVRKTDCIKGIFFPPELRI
jgi:hypothetical protein